MATWGQPPSAVLEQAQTFEMISYVNYYRCPKDGAEWADAWSCMCNAKCPVCSAEIEPYGSDKIRAPLAHEFAMQH